MPVWDKVTKLKRLLGVTKRVNTAWRADAGLLREPKANPGFRKGRAVFDKPYDPKDIQAASSFRQYVGPRKARVNVPKDDEFYINDFEKVWQLFGKFQFEVGGHFPKDAELAEREVFDAAFRLNLVGWMKVRPAFMLGHVQGDVLSLAYFRKWLEQKHMTPAAGTMSSVNIWQENTGIRPPLDYKNLFCIKDRRRYKNKKVHLLTALERQQIREFEQRM